MQFLGNLAVNQAPAAQAVDVSQDDVIVIHYHTPPSMADAREATAAARHFWPRNKVLIMSGDVTVSTLSSEQLNALVNQA